MLKVSMRRICALVCVAAAVLCGCSSDRPELDIKGYTIRFTTGIEKEALIDGEGVSLTDGQVKLLLSAVRDGYEAALTSDIWAMELDKVPFGSYVDDMVLDMAARLVLVNMLAQDKHIELNAGETADCAERAELFYSEYAQTASYVTQGEVTELFAMMKLSDKVYDELTRDVDTQISVDEARVIKIQYIYSKSSDAAAESRLDGVLEEYENGADFASLAGKYSDSQVYSAEIGRGELEQSFEEAAFNLDAGQISGIVRCDSGLYVIYCIDDNAAGKAESQAESIIQRRRSEQFESSLADFSEGITLSLNERAWEKLKSEY